MSNSLENLDEPHVFCLSSQELTNEPHKTVPGVSILSSVKPASFALAVALSLGVPVTNAESTVSISPNSTDKSNQTTQNLNSHKVRDSQNLSHNLSRMNEIIWRYYSENPEIASVKFVKTTETVRGETKSFVDRILSMIGYTKNTLTSPKPNLAPVVPSIELPILARASKKYLDEHRDEVIAAYPNKRIVLGYSPNSKQMDSLLLLPLPLENTDSKESTTVKIGNSSFTITPIPKSNGYNTEYKITNQKGEEIRQLSLLFPSINSQFEAQKNKVLALEESIDKLRAQIAKLTEKDHKKEKGNQKIQTTVLNNAKLKKVLETELAKSSQELIQSKKTLTTLVPVNYISYIPYTQFFNTSKIRSQGMEYLRKGMLRAYTDNASHAPINQSKSVIQRLAIEETIPYQLPLILNIIERMDFHEYFESDGKTLKSQRMLEELMFQQSSRALTTFGLNMDESFRYQKSKEGALGVGQIMRTTYSRFQKHEIYGNFLPETDYVVAAMDHTSSFKLQILHFNDQIYQFPEIVRKNWSLLMKSEDTKIALLTLLAAGYNGSMKRIVDEIFPDKKINDIEQLRKLITPEAIQRAMEKARNEKITPLEASLKGVQPEDQKSKNGAKKSSGKIKKLSPAQVLVIKKKIAEINDTFKESSTYALKAGFVWRYLNKEYPKYIH